MQRTVLLQPRCSVLERNGLRVKHSAATAAQGDVGICAPWDYPTGQSWIWIPVGAVTLQSKKSGQAVGSTGQIYARGQTVPKHATPK